MDSSGKMTGAYASRGKVIFCQGRWFTALGSETDKLEEKNIFVPTKDWVSKVKKKRQEKDLLKSCGREKRVNPRKKG